MALCGGGQELHLKDLKAGEPVCKQGDPARSLFTVCFDCEQPSYSTTHLQRRAARHTSRHTS